MEIKVLFITHYRQLYGANRSMLQLMLELMVKGVRPTAVVPKRPVPAGSDLLQELEKHGIPYVESDIRIDKHAHWLKAVPNYILASLGRRKTYEAVKRLDFDLVHTNSSVTSTGAYIAKKTNRPHVWHLREFGREDYGIRTPFGKWFQKTIYSGRNTFIAISDHIARHYRRYAGTQDIRRIYNGIPLSAPITPRTNRNKQVEICIVGFIRPEKGQIQLIEAAHELVNKRSIRNFHITIVGGGEENYVSTIRDYISRHELTNFITLTGRRNDVPDILAKMDIGVMASTNEAFGRVTVEYMMAGLAVIASDGGANTEIIEDGVTGCIYPKGNSTVLAECLEDLITDPDRRTRLAKDGQRHAMENFSSKANSDAVYLLYNEILSRQ